MVKKLTLLMCFFVSLFVLTLLFKGGRFGIVNDVIFKIRLNKSIILAMGSFSIGFSTWILQRFTRNKIIDSSFFGIASFNILMLVFIYTFISSSNSINFIYKWIIPFSSIGASIIISILLSVTLFANQRFSKKNIVLIGIMLNYLFTAISYVYIKFLNPNEASAILDISIGTINEGYHYIIPLILFIFQILTILWYILIYKGVNIVNLHEDIAAKQGQNIRWIKIQQISIVGIHIAISFSLLGSISFLGIIAANLTSSLFKYSKWNAVISGVIAICITMLAYVMMNSLIETYYPIGITSSLISVPYFIYKILRRNYD